MSQQSLSKQAVTAEAGARPPLTLRAFLIQAAVSLAATAALIAMALRAEGLQRVVHYAQSAAVHRPRLSLLAEAGPAIQIHVAGVVGALVVGAVLMSGVKGNRLHRTLGWGWVVVMATAAVASLFIMEVNRGSFSFLHLLSGWTLISLPVAVVAARRHKVRLHSRTMTGLFVGGLVVAGATAFLPGRLMWRIFFG